MRPVARTVAWGLAALVVGAIPAFALAATSFFADGPFSERLVALSVYGIVLLALGAAGGAFSGSARTSVAIGLAVPVLPCLLLLATAGSLRMYLLGAAFVAVAFASALAGTRAGARLAAEVARRKL